MEHVPHGQTHKYQCLVKSYMHLGHIHLDSKIATIVENPVIVRYLTSHTKVMANKKKTKIFLK